MEGVPQPMIAAAHAIAMMHRKLFWRLFRILTLIPFSDSLPRYLHPTASAPILAGFPFPLTAI
jgi:hypothetical protein